MTSTLAHAPQPHAEMAAGARRRLLSIQPNIVSPAPGAFTYSVDQRRAHGGCFTFDSAIQGHALLDLAAATEH